MNAPRAVTNVSVVENVTTLLVDMNASTRVLKVSVKQPTAHALVFERIVITDFKMLYSAFSCFTDILIVILTI